MCAGLCADRKDRASAVTPELNRRNTELRDAIGADPHMFNLVARRFHAAIADNCGNKSLSLLVGGLIMIWSAHEESYSRRADPKAFPGETARKRICEVHERIAEAIRAGNAAEATRLSAAHLSAAQQHHFAVETRELIDASLLR